MNRELLDELLGDVRRRFYTDTEPRAFFNQRRGIIKAITWPAAWLRRHGFTSEVTAASYRKLILVVLDDIAMHGKAQFAECNYFPAYLLKCMQDHCRRHTEAVLFDFKQLRNRVDFTALVGALKSNVPAAAPAKSVVETFAEAHALLAAPKRQLGTGRARPETDRQLAFL